MDDVCVHCGKPAHISDADGLATHAREDGGKWLCSDESGHVACLAQGGYE